MLTAMGGVAEDSSWLATDDGAAVASSSPWGDEVSIPLKWDMGIAPMFPTLRRSPAVYRFRVL